MSRCVCLLAAFGLAVSVVPAGAASFLTNPELSEKPALSGAETPALSAVEGQPADQLPSVTVCGTSARPAAQPPSSSGPVVLFIAPCFEAQGNQSLIEAQTYLYYIQLKQSRPSEGVWVPYTDASEKTIEEDFHRLWNTNF